MFTLEDVEVHYGDVRAVAGLSMRVEPGEAVAVVGESGAGKSTIGRIILALEQPTQGRYEFDGEDVAGKSRAELLAWRRKVQAVFQNPTAALDPRMRIRDLVTEAVGVQRRLSGRERRELATTLLNQVGLQESLADRYPHELSGGQCQRVAIARAMSVQPSLLVLDEPVSGLDVSVRARVLNLLAEVIRGSEMTVVYVTHDLATVAHLCDRIYVMYQGLIVEELAAEDLHVLADHPYTQLLVASILDVGEQVDLTELSELGQARRVVDTTTGCPFAARCPYAVARCIEELPGLHALSERHRSRCHFAGQDKTETVTPDASPTHPIDDALRNDEESHAAH